MPFGWLVVDKKGLTLYTLLVRSRRGSPFRCTELACLAWKDVAFSLAFLATGYLSELDKTDWLKRGPSQKGKRKKPAPSWRVISLAFSKERADPTILFAFFYLNAGYGDPVPPHLLVGSSKKISKLFSRVKKIPILCFCLINYSNYGLRNEKGTFAGLWDTPALSLACLDK